MANEKRRRRRESHNAVERRRRDNINEKISELATLIPECLLDAGTGSSKEMGIDVRDPPWGIAVIDRSFFPFLGVRHHARRYRRRRQGASDNQGKQGDDTQKVC